MGFFPEGTSYGSRPPSRVNTLEEAVARLNPAAKQAMFSAASHGLIKRRSWDGCAFNKAGEEVGSLVSNTTAAARAFKLPERVVAEFIRVWDTLPGTDEECTRRLREAIEKVGLFTEPSTAKRLVQTVRSRVYTSYETKMREAFDASNAEAPVEGAAMIGELLSASC